MSTLQDLDGAERLRLMRFVCSFVWADLRVSDEERELVCAMIRRLHLDDDERAQVGEWLQVPPREETVDPTRVPAEHRRLFRQAIEAVIVADGRVTPEEYEALRLFDRLTETA